VSSGAVIDARSCSARGIVTAVEADRIEIELAAPPRCHGCHGACAWYEIASRPRRAVLATRRTFGVGAAVSLGLAGRYWVLAAAVVYGVPLAALLGGAVLGFGIAGTDLGTATGAAAGLTAAATLGRWLRRYCEHVTLRSLVVESLD
jgi:positive regulator of sigma E activity